MTQEKARNRVRIHQNPDRTLPRSKILRGKLNFQRLFERSSVIKQSPLLCRYRIDSNIDSRSMFGFIAPKKVFRRAVDRNRTKRLLREAFRLNQHLLPESVRNNKIGFHAVFIATGNNLSFSDTEKRMISILNEISRRLTSGSTSESDNNPQKTD
ncbi:ribonuclease P protein component [Rhodohalobacter sp. SW132]|uniref:ribonuclease P protein component n=1 Tax=Rhodohalobacter sp. SW132 TaxID=2293433 RepID=UPI001F197B72|nr:ribonuclease P protein component [Rhodohalobacter sp. SW132]